MTTTNDNISERELKGIAGGGGYCGLPDKPIILQKKEKESVAVSELVGAAGGGGDCGLPNKPIIFPKKEEGKVDQLEGMGG